MSTWFTADTHFHHARIIELGKGRPFHSVGAMNDALVANWNRKVLPGDTVWVLGDFVLGRKDETLSITRRLNGYKNLVVGNHDGPFDQRPAKAAEWLAKYLAAGFDVVTDGPVGYRLFGTVPVLLSHFPYQADERHEDRFERWSPVDAGLPLLHGHVHTSWTLQGRQLNVGVDVQGFAPVSQAEVYQQLHSGGALRRTEDVGQ